MVRQVAHLSSAEWLVRRSSALQCLIAQCCPLKASFPSSTLGGSRSVVAVEHRLQQCSAALNGAPPSSVSSPQCCPLKASFPSSALGGPRSVVAVEHRLQQCSAALNGAAPSSVSSPNGVR